MVREALAASGALIALVAFPVAPHAAADDGQIVEYTSAPHGTLRCQVSADNVARGGGPMVVCARADGQPFGGAPFATEKNGVILTLAVERGTGEFHWDKGTVAGASGITLNAGQTYHINGWTIQPDDERTRFTYDATGHGVLINAVVARGF
jgi:hypothetical protein